MVESEAMQMIRMKACMNILVLVSTTNDGARLRHSYNLKKLEWGTRQILCWKLCITVGAADDVIHSE